MCLIVIPASGNYICRCSIDSEKADLAVKYNMAQFAIGCYSKAILLAQTHNLPEEYADLVEKSYQVGWAMSDEEISASEFGFTSYHYLKTENKENKEKCQLLRERNKKIFGEDWLEQVSLVLDGKFEVTPEPVKVSA